MKSVIRLQTVPMNLIERSKKFTWHVAQAISPNIDLSPENYGTGVSYTDQRIPLKVMSSWQFAVYPLMAQLVTCILELTSDVYHLKIQNTITCCSTKTSSWHLEAWDMKLFQKYVIHPWFIPFDRGETWNAELSTVCSIWLEMIRKTVNCRMLIMLRIF